jgi:hypothetical protein
MLREEDQLSPGVRGQPGQQRKTMAQKKKKAENTSQEANYLHLFYPRNNTTFYKNSRNRLFLGSHYLPNNYWQIGINVSSLQHHTVNWDFAKIPR